MSDATDLGIKLSDLWYAEYASWTMDFDAGAGTEWPWIVRLEWTQEYGNPHHADWSTYTWEFRGRTVEEALTDAVDWAQQLWWLAPCGECDGQGEWNGKPCGECASTGLAHRAEAAAS